jgi:hypothetical protein
LILYFFLIFFFLFVFSQKQNHIKASNVAESKSQKGTWMALTKKTGTKEWQPFEEVLWA